VKTFALAAILLAAPLAARADIGIRVGGAASLASHAAGNTNVITDNWPLGIDVMGSWWLPTSLLSLDLELSEGFLLTPPAGADKRTGTVLRPGVRFSPPILPIYLRGAIPINIEPAPAGQERFDLRLGAGFTIPLVLFKVYIEGDADFPLGGGDSAPGAFSTWNFSLNGGLDFRF
jgi:hypothetical protein